MAAAERVFRLLDSHSEVVSPANAVAGDQSGCIEFRDVWFTYQRLTEEQLARIATATSEELRAQSDIEWILCGVSFTLEPNETAAIVGHTGAGKTTITNLMMRFYDIQRGTILVDGVDVRRQNLKALRQRFGVVLQDPFLFSGTIGDNIRLGSSWITTERMQRAAEEVNLGDFIRSLPQQFDEPVRERGSTLSTGQKQLISFARALAHDPGILILDEATSSVDTDTELRVRLALSRMIQGRTSVLIAHRLSTIQRADIILGNAQRPVARARHAPATACRARTVLEAVFSCSIATRSCRTTRIRRTAPSPSSLSDLLAIFLVTTPSSSPRIFLSRRRGQRRPLRRASARRAAGLSAWSGIFRPGRCGDGRRRHAMHRPQRSGGAHGHYGSAAPHARRLRELPQAGPLDPRAKAAGCRADRLPGRELPSRQALQAASYSRDLVRQSAALGVEAPPPALGAATRREDARHLSL